MNLNSKIKQLVRSYTLSLRREGIPIEKVYIFGSFAKGKANKDSDVDVAIISSKFGKDRQKERVLLLRKRNNKALIIEPHPFSEDEFKDVSYNPLVAQIKKHAVRISLLALIIC